jgi:hypothetical protein
MHVFGFINTTVDSS